MKIFCERGEIADAAGKAWVEDTVVGVKNRGPVQFESLKVDFGERNENLDRKEIFAMSFRGRGYIGKPCVEGEGF